MPNDEFASQEENKAYEVITYKDNPMKMNQKP